MRAIALPSSFWPRFDARARYVAGIVAIALVYLAGGELAIRLHELAGIIGEIWVPSGFGLAVILLYGPRWWPGIAIGTFLTVVLRNTPLAALIGSTTDVFEALATYYVLRVVLRMRVQLDRVRDVAAFAAVEIVVSAVGATLGATAFVAVGLARHQELLQLWSSWWWFSIGSDLIMTPALLTWATRAQVPRLDKRRRRTEATALVIAGMILLALLLTSVHPRWIPLRPFTLMPLLLWAGLRFGPRGAATATFVVSTAAVIADVFGTGPFTRTAELQAFIVVSSVTTLMLSALAQERVRAVARKVAIQLGALDAIITIDTSGRVLELNPAAEELFLVRESEVLGKELADLAIPPRLRHAYHRALHEYVARNGTSVAGTRYRTTAWRAADGLEFPVEIAVTRIPIEDQLVLTGFVRDVTTEQAAEIVRIEAAAELERKVTERTSQLENALREKDVLLREVHHRVKNNLQVISSLLNLQLAAEPSESTRRGLRESQNRILSMALVHQLLYRSRDFARIDVGAYLHDLVCQIVKAYNVRPERIATIVTAPPAPLDLDRAIPCGLIVNELVSNALEHAFPAPRTGTIKVALDTRERLIELTVADDGIGMTTPLGESTSTFGLRIVKTLALQLEGTVEHMPGPGTSIRVTFPNTPVAS
ncbi:MAG: PAS domain S-box protein [Kofleriaceae bacterium]|nr:PAS domain S-box protein [Kofleriaceae bacterium]